MPSSSHQIPQLSKNQFSANVVLHKNILNRCWYSAKTSCRMQASRKCWKPHVISHPLMRLVQNKSVQHRPSISLQVPRMCGFRLQVPFQMSQGQNTMAVKDGSGRPAAHTAKGHFLNWLETSFKPCLHLPFCTASFQMASCFLQVAFVWLGYEKPPKLTTASLQYPRFLFHTGNTKETSCLSS